MARCRERVFNSPHICYRVLFHLMALIVVGISARPKPMYVVDYFSSSSFIHFSDRRGKFI